MDIKIELDDKRLQAGVDMSPVMKIISVHLADSVEESFERESSPDGKVWAQRKPSTLNTKRYRRRKPRKVLQFGGDLVRSITADWSATEAVAGINLVYATTHQFGAKKGQFGTGSFKKSTGSFPILWGDIPARPFLGIWPEHYDRVRESLIEFIVEGWN